jgi:hypothetical protein
MRGIARYDDWRHTAQRLDVFRERGRHAGLPLRSPGLTGERGRHIGLPLQVEGLCQ